MIFCVIVFYCPPFCAACLHPSAPTQTLSAQIVELASSFAASASRVLVVSRVPAFYWFKAIHIVPRPGSPRPVRVPVTVNPLLPLFGVYASLHRWACPLSREPHCTVALRLLSPLFPPNSPPHSMVVSPTPCYSTLYHPSVLMPPSMAPTVSKAYHGPSSPPNAQELSGCHAVRQPCREHALHDRRPDPCAWASLPARSIFPPWRNRDFER